MEARGAYTDLMLGLLLNIFLVQTATANTVYEIEHNGETIYGYVEEVAGGILKVTFDEPWNDNPNMKHFRKSEVSYVKEVVGQRDKRIEREARALGYELARTASGERWLDIDQLERARWSREEAGLSPEPIWDQAEEASPVSESFEEIGPDSTEPSTVAASPRWRGALLWGAQGGIILVAGMLIGLVTWKYVL